MKVFVVVVCLAAICVAGQDGGDGGVAVNDAPTSNVTDADEAGKIINGWQANPKELPYQVGIFHTVNGNRQFCGGSLISDQWILTAGHCVYGGSDFEIILGATRAYDAQPGKITSKIEKALYHPQYQASPLTNDVAVIKLIQRVQFSDYIKKINLPRSSDFLQANQEILVSGWGKTSDSQNQIVNELSYVKLMTISNQECKQHFIPSLIQNNVVCCDGSQITSTCSGDSGGPGVMYIRGHLTVVTVTSFVDTRGCAKGYPSGYARVGSFLDFIRVNTGVVPS